MSYLVQKFGGTSVGDLERIENVAGIIASEVRKNNKVIAIVSAMSGETNRLVEQVKQTSPVYDGREYDVIVSTGENITAGLLAIKLQDLGIPARSWMGWQIPIITTSMHSNARILEIKTENIEKKFVEGMKVAIVSGFQGISKENRISTLGRGGSDTTAVAISAAFNAKRCDIFTDVEGIFTTDPRIVKSARKLDKISYEEMLELASMGAKVLHTRSVELAMRYDVNLQVLSSFQEKIGTLVCREDKMLESRMISGVASSKDEAKVTLSGVLDKPGIAAAIFGPLSESGINVDMIIQNVSENETTDITFSCPMSQVSEAEAAINKASKKKKISFKACVIDTEVAKVSIIGIGMRSHAGIAKKMFESLANENINILVISTSEIKISILVEQKYMELAVQVLHDAFELDKV
tara:strand:+ start:3229 stop:4455 length:1227 start_codon:yes stop_codon:yes gene_type:complete